MPDVHRVGIDAVARSMQVSTSFEDETTIVLSVTGEIDVATADDLRDIGLGLLQSSQCETLCADLSAVTFLDSTGLGALIALRTAAVDSGRTMLIRNPSVATARLFELTGLSEVLGVVGRDHND
jgi:anti-sigma B factor antagonist